MTKASTAKEMRGLVACFHTFGQTQEAFAKAHGVSKQIKLLDQESGRKA